MTLKEMPTGAQLDTADRRRKVANLNRYFFLAGLAGAPICIWGDLRWHSFPWLIGLGVSVYFVVSSVTDAVMRTRDDVRALREANAARRMNPLVSMAAPEVPPSVKPLRMSPYFRAGVMGLPFCVFEWFVKHEPVFLLGGGFFAGLLMATLFAQWSRTRIRNATADGNGSVKAR